MSEINELAPAIMIEVEGHADGYPYPSFLHTIWLVIQSYVRTMLGLKRVTEVAPALQHKSYPSYYLRPFHSQPAGYLCPVASSTFDRTFGYVFGRHVQRMREATADALGDVANGTVIDLGCGTGTLFQTLSRRLPEAKLIGVDLSPYMLAVALRNTASVPNVSLFEGDVCAAPLPDACANGVTVAFVFHEMPREAVERTMSEAYRLLEAGGRLVILDTVIETSWVARLFHAVYVRIAHEPYAEVYARAAVDDMLASCGFEHLRTQYLARAMGVRVWQKPAAGVAQMAQ